MRTDLRFCMSSYLQYRTIVDKDLQFSERVKPRVFEPNMDRAAVNTPEELDLELQKQVKKAIERGRCALMLSSGMDSAILAHYLPEGTKAYTLQCQAENGIDETDAAAVYAHINGLDHEIVQVTWDDYQNNALELMRRKGCPIHSLEVQVQKAALKAKQDGIDILIFGETADIIYGGHSQLLGRDWTKEEFVRRFSFVDPTVVMRDPFWIEDPVFPYVKEDGYVDVPGFLNGFEYPVSLGFYHNACDAAGILCCTPYAHTVLGHSLDMQRIRSGESKYVVRELYRQLYPQLPVPAKTPLPRPMKQWLAEWKGPMHPALICDNIQRLSGDQKWYVYALDLFLRYVMEA